mmetsp:Transcript_627/g.1435  ORF Transcript_627/g.1435 Transcript_627/m.1435 type:complete len:222 (-) Transcript_627:779-1444(-)
MTSRFSPRRFVSSSEASSALMAPRPPMPPPPPADWTRSASSAIASRARTASTSPWTTDARSSKSRSTSQKYGLGMSSILSTCVARMSMIRCSATASALAIPETFEHDADAPPAPVTAPPGAAPPVDPRTLDSATPLRAATFSTGHAPCIFARAVASPARSLRRRASPRFVSADCDRLWICARSAFVCRGRAAAFDGARRRGDPAAASAGEGFSPPATTAPP